MIKTIAHHYNKLSSTKRILLGVSFVLGIFVTSFFGFLRASTIPFSPDLETIFPRLNTGYYSDAHFHFGGNDFAGIFFWQTGETLSTPENITINGGTQSIDCSTRVRGIYYNNQRWRTIWPLDANNLALLTWSTIATWYDSMTITGGFYTNCTWVSGYLPETDEIYGQITHTLSGNTWYDLFAWLAYDFTGNAISGAVFADTLSFTGWLYDGFVFDTYGGIAELTTNVSYCDDFIVAPTIINEWDNTVFTCYGTNATGYLLNIFASWGSSALYSELAPNSWTSNMRLTWSALSEWDYFATCTVIWNNSIGGGQCGINFPFQITWGTTPSGSGCSPDFQWTLSFGPLSGSRVTNPSLWTYYTNTTGIMLQWAATAPNNVYITWDFSPAPITSWYMGTDIFNHLATYPITLSHLNQWNYFTSTFSTGGCTYTGANKRVFIDTIAPTTPIVSTPISGAYVCPSLPLPIERLPSTDTGSNLSHYTYQLYTNSWITTGLVLSGTSTSNDIDIDISYLPLGTYYLIITAIDNVWLSSPSATIPFTTSQSYCPVGTGIMIVSPVISITNADLDTAYRSDPIYIMGLTGPTLLSISSGMLFVNNTTGALGSTWMVTSNDTIYIELISSNAYDTTASSTLSILWTTGSFSVTTKRSNCVLSAGEQLVIQNLYENLKDSYDNDIYKLADFLNTFQSMVTDEVELTNSCTLEYLLRLIEEDLWFEWGIDTSNHIAPNCKEYHIGYDAWQQAYYSPEMMNRYYFINRESLIRHLDYYNPGDCHINSYGNNYRTQNNNDDPMRHVAPNGKIYNIIGQYGGFSAQEFISPKYFDSLEGIKSYINIKNPAKTIWTHSIDTAFFPIVYAAPNGKEYRIYKTNRWYMSYKLMKVQYFSTLSEIKSYIDKNNPSRR